MIINDDASLFIGQERYTACVVVGRDDSGDLTCTIALNPHHPWRTVKEAEAWAIGLLARVQEFGLDRAVEMDGWKRRADGHYQLWAQPHEIADPFA